FPTLKRITLGYGACVMTRPRSAFYVGGRTVLAGPSAAPRERGCLSRSLVALAPSASATRPNSPPGRSHVRGADPLQVSSSDRRSRGGGPGLDAAPAARRVGASVRRSRRSTQDVPAPAPTDGHRQRAAARDASRGRRGALEQPRE